MRETRECAIAAVNCFVVLLACFKCKCLVSGYELCNGLRCLYVQVFCGEILMDALSGSSTGMIR